MNPLLARWVRQIAVAVVWFAGATLPLLCIIAFVGRATGNPAKAWNDLRELFQLGALWGIVSWAIYAFLALLLERGALREQFYAAMNGGFSGVVGIWLVSFVWPLSGAPSFLKFLVFAWGVAIGSVCGRLPHWKEVD